MSQQLNTVEKIICNIIAGLRRVFGDRRNMRFQQGKGQVVEKTKKSIQINSNHGNRKEERIPYVRFEKLCCFRIIVPGQIVFAPIVD